MANLLELRNLRVEFYTQTGRIIGVDDVSLDIAGNEILVLAGESGSGKTVTALSLTGILPPNARIVSGRAEFLGRDLFRLEEQSLVKVRGGEISYIFQEPASFLNPVYTIGTQIIESIMLHQSQTKSQASGQALELLNLVKIKDPQRVFSSYPHQLSGGMNQRAFIAMSLACRPKLLIADEPTTSLDVTVEAQILELLVGLRKEMGFSMLFITHNLSIAKKIADRICVMYKGRIEEEGDREGIFGSPKHFHTRELIAAYERIGRI